jgi:hypothetical protein
MIEAQFGRERLRGEPPAFTVLLVERAGKLNDFVRGTEREFWAFSAADLVAELENAGFARLNPGHCARLCDAGAIVPLARREGT